jgi:glycerophosphoryl diester phosphodiesterase
MWHHAAEAAKVQTAMRVKAGLRRAAWAGALVGAALYAAPAAADADAEVPAVPVTTAARPLVIGHRGAAGYLPEHTLEGYALAIELGADYIEPDLVATKDGVLIARHEPNIIDTTNVRELPQFAHRRRTAVVDGVAQEGYFASDFSYAEIQQMRAVQSIAERDQGFNARFRIPTLDQIIELAQRKSAELGRVIGIYPETKHPSWHRELGLALEDRLLDALQRHGWNHRDAPVFIQSFEQDNLKLLHAKTQVRLVQLIGPGRVGPDGRISHAANHDRPYDWTVSGRAGSYGDLLTRKGLAEVRTYADGIGPWKGYLISTACVAVIDNGCADSNGDGRLDDADRKLLAPSDLVSSAHAQGLLVHPYTFRNEPRRLARDFAGNPVNEYVAFFDLGVDGVFSDFADTAVVARALWALKHDRDATQCLVQGPQAGQAACKGRR